MWYGIIWSDANRNMIRTHKQRKPQKPNEWAYDLTEWNAQRRRIAAAAAITISLLTDIRKCYNNDWVSQMHTQAHPRPRCGWCGSDERIQKEPFYQKALLGRNQLWICQKPYKIHLDTNKKVLHWFCDLYCIQWYFFQSEGVKGQSSIIRAIIFITYVSLKYSNASNYERCNSCFAAIEEKKCDVLISKQPHSITRTWIHKYTRA